MRSFPIVAKLWEGVFLMSIKRFTLASFSFLLTGVLFACVLTGWIFAQTMTLDESIDMVLGALESPNVQRLLVPPGTQEGAPVYPPYKQEPPAAQSDFRPKPAPLPIPTPTPIPTPPPDPTPPKKNFLF